MNPLRSKRSGIEVVLNRRALVPILSLVLPVCFLSSCDDDDGGFLTEGGSSGNQTTIREVSFGTIKSTDFSGSTIDQRVPAGRAAVLNELIAGDVFLFFPISGVDILEVRGVDLADFPGNSDFLADVRYDDLSRRGFVERALREDRFNDLSPEVVPDGTRVVLVDGGSIDGALRLEYSRTGDHAFRYSGDFVAAEGLFYDALNAALSDPAPDGDAFRLNLLQPDATTPVFSRGQLLAIAYWLREYGAFVSLNPADNSLFVPEYIQYDFVSNSLNLDLAIGEMFGTYNAIARGVEVVFRRPTAAEVASGRGITLDHWIPVLSQSGAGANVTINDFEEGRYELDLNIEPTNIRS